MGYKTKIGGKLECTVRIKLLFINTSLINTHYDVKKKLLLCNPFKKTDWDSETKYQIVLKRVILDIFGFAITSSMCNITK